MNSELLSDFLCVKGGVELDFLVLGDIYNDYYLYCLV